MLMPDFGPFVKAPPTEDHNDEGRPGPSIRHRNNARRRSQKTAADLISLWCRSDAKYTPPTTTHPKAAIFISTVADFVAGRARHRPGLLCRVHPRAGKFSHRCGGTGIQVSPTGPGRIDPLHQDIPDQKHLESARKE